MLKHREIQRRHKLSKLPIPEAPALKAFHGFGILGFTFWCFSCLAACFPPLDERVLEYAKRGSLTVS